MWREGPTWRTTIEAWRIKVGNVFEKDTRMGDNSPIRGWPMRWRASLPALSVQRGAFLQTDGKRIGNEGFFVESTVLTGTSPEACIMNEESFGRSRQIIAFKSYDEVAEEANRRLVPSGPTA
ncbi:MULTISPECIES: aldehyde dehydrogenase family protein [Bradyrhizobium]|nr:MULTISPECIES: aldehyde dehydrogenase family protein [Bradyrhizobium]MDN4985361.1 aldehyde dehydrogenase family protein [Bradyrhizobium sp. WYCCWR 13022]MDN5006322.1 aldehyde dehydrogenase family protein [Bradyrhizobium sp. WYCCWR 12677]MDT4738005.1 aldehyde dehydrogenase family protein [Bradyrhizobium sp. WYCCWR 12699]